MKTATRESDAAIGSAFSTQDSPAGRSIASDTAQTIVARFLTYVTAFVSSVLVSRYLGPLGRGEYYLPVVTATTVATLCAVGIEQSNVALFGNRRATLETLWKQCGAVALLMGTLGICLAVGAPVAVPRFFGGAPVIGLFWIAALTIPFVLHTQFTAGLLTLRGMVTWQFKATLTASLIQVALLVTLALSGALRVWSVLVVTLVFSVLTWAVMVIPFGGIARLRIGLQREVLRETLSQAVPLHASSVLLFLHLRADMFMVEAYAGTSALGLYSLAVTLAETVSLVTDSLSIAILPRQVGNVVVDAANLALRGVRANAIIGTALACAWALSGAFLIPFVFGSEFAPAYRPLVVLLPGIVFLGMQRVCGGAVLRSNHPWRIAAIQGVSLAGNVALNAWTIPAFGSAGAALASTVSYALGALIFIAWTARMAGTSCLKASLPRWSDVTALVFHGQEAAMALRSALTARRH